MSWMYTLLAYDATRSLRLCTPVRAVAGEGSDVGWKQYLRNDISSSQRGVFGILIRMKPTSEATLKRVHALIFAKVDRWGQPHFMKGERTGGIGDSHD